MGRTAGCIAVPRVRACKSVVGTVGRAATTEEDHWGSSTGTRRGWFLGGFGLEGGMTSASARRLGRLGMFVPWYLYYHMHGRGIRLCWMSQKMIPVPHSAGMRSRIPDSGNSTGVCVDRISRCVIVCRRALVLVGLVVVFNGSRRRCFLLPSMRMLLLRTTRSNHRFRFPVSGAKLM